MTNTQNSPGQAAKKIQDFLNILSKTGGLRLTPKIVTSSGEVQSNSGEALGANPDVSVELSGADTPLLLARNGELLLAIEHLAAKIGERHALP